MPKVAAQPRAFSLLCAIASAVLVTGCAREPAPIDCPSAAAVAPAAIGGAAYVAGLTDRLAGADRENVILEAIGEMRHADPAMRSDAITNVLIAADCPVAAARPDHTAAASRARIAHLRAQVDQLLGSGAAPN